MRGAVADLKFNLELVIESFTGKGPLIRRLCLADQTFRGLCEDYGLARLCLARFEKLDATHSQEIEDYRSVIAALEAEIATRLDAPGAQPGPGERHRD